MADAARPYAAIRRSQTGADHAAPLRKAANHRSHEALHGDNPDKARHILASLREL